jgi:hypothetical protein
MMEATYSHIVSADQADEWNATHPMACGHCNTSA